MFLFQLSIPQLSQVGFHCTPEILNWVQIRTRWWSLPPIYVYVLVHTCSWGHYPAGIFAPLGREQR